MKPDGNFYSDEEMQAGEIQATINGLVARAESAESALSLLTAKLAQCEEKLAEMTARAMSLALHVPPETLCGAVQQWRDEVKAQLAAHAKALERVKALEEFKAKLGQMADGYERAAGAEVNEQYAQEAQVMCDTIRDAIRAASAPATTGKGGAT